MPLSWIYAKIIGARNILYDRGVFEKCDLGARTISIGNITTGGTGKTPLVAYVAEVLSSQGKQVCILTRGYGRSDPKRRVLVSDGDRILADSREAGDEPFELAQKLLGKVIVIADPDRVSAAEWAQRRFGVTAFVLDDGFQHRMVKRDVDIVCIDATDPFGGGKMLPAGRLREPAANLSRADIIVITRANLTKDISNLRSEISELNTGATVFVAKNEILKVAGLEEVHDMTRRPHSEENVDDRHIESNVLNTRERRAFAFCGIGNPESFFEQLRQENFSITATRIFRDHHVYTQRDIDSIQKQAGECGAEILLATAKDAVKLTRLKFEIPCFVVEIKIVIDDAKALAASL